MSLATLVQSLTEYAHEATTDYAIACEDEEPINNPEALAIVLVAIRECRAELANLYDVVERDCLGEMGEKRMLVGGVGEVEVKHATTRTAWEYDSLVPAIVARLADEPGVFYDPKDGVFLPSATIGANVARRLRECLSISGGKVTGLRALGIDPDEYCHTEHGKAQIKLPKRTLA